MTDDHADPSDALLEHLTRHIGPLGDVWHELQSAIVPIDVLVFPPSHSRPYFTLVTAGMSHRPMRVPIEDPDDLTSLADRQFAELLLCLPPDWPLSLDDFREEANYWPIRWLKRLARLPHLSDRCLELGHTIPNGDPPVPFAPTTPFCGWLVDEPVLFAPELHQLRVTTRVINIFSIIPLFAEEMGLKLRQGWQALRSRMNQHRISELIDLQRKNVAYLPETI